jgi:hypothetical protein
MVSVTKRGVAGSKSTLSSVAAAGAAGDRATGQKEKQQAATNVLVIELNEEVVIFYINCFL